MMTGVVIAHTSSSGTTAIQVKTSVPALMLGAVTQSSTQRTIRGKGIMTDKTQIYASGTIIPPVGR